MPAHPDTYARFYMHPAPQNDETGLMQNVTHKDVLYVEISVKGSTTTKFSRPATEEDKKNYPGAWKLYETGTPELTGGTPLAYLKIGPSQVLDLQNVGFTCVEDIAEMQEPALSNIKGAHMLKRKALAYLKAMAEADAEEQEEPAQAQSAPSSKKKKTGTAG